MAGALALYLQANPGASPAATTDALVSNSTPGKVTGAGSGSPNRLLDSLFGTAPPTDGTSPTTSVTSPLPQATVSGRVTVAASAADDVGVSRVDFYADDALIGSDTSSPYEVSWNTTTVVEVRSPSGALLGALAVFTNRNGTAIGSYSAQSLRGEDRPSGSSSGRRPTTACRRASGSTTCRSSRPVP